MKLVKSGFQRHLLGWKRLPPLLGLVGLLSTRWKESSCALAKVRLINPSFIARLRQGCSQLQGRLVCRFCIRFQ